MLRFLLPKFVDHPRTFDFLCVILEDAALTDTMQKIPFEIGESSLANRTATEVSLPFNHFICHIDLLTFCLYLGTEKVVRGF